jgi:hypothetical protein
MVGTPFLDKSVYIFAAQYFSANFPAGGKGINGFEMWFPERGKVQNEFENVVSRVRETAKWI